MKLFKCQHCEQLLYFENRLCEVCHHRLGYLPDAATLTALEPAQPEAETASSETLTWRTLAKPSRAVRFCANAALDGCNWLVPANSEATLCAACRHNHTVPDLSDPAKRTAWHNLELAKHRLFYTLLRLKLPLANRLDDPEHGLVFDFLAETAAKPKILTGHENGLITLNLNEADDAEREKMRQTLGEPYRTLLGHFRHEVGHYFWDVLVRDGGYLQECRAVFGDDSADYNEALKTHYAQGPAPNWQDHFISAYATSHPWEDFAESWAHYLHIVDTLETAHAFGIRIQPRIVKTPELRASMDFDPHQASDIETIIEAWLPLTFAMNSLSRSMGQADLYPFILSADAIQKLGFIHKIIHKPKMSTASRARGKSQSLTG